MISAEGYTEKSCPVMRHEKSGHPSISTANAVYRSDCRFLYSNDGLMFVTYDHYDTFYAVGYGVDAEEEGMTDFQKAGFKVEELLSW